MLYIDKAHTRAVYFMAKKTERKGKYYVRTEKPS